LLTASASENSDLFWGIRGGGGNFGIVTSFEYRLQPVGPEVQPLRDFGPPVFDGIMPKPFAAHNSSLDAGQPTGKHYYWKSEYATEIADDAIESLVAFAANMTSPFSRLAVFQLGGAIKRYDEQTMAVSHRNAEYIYAINTGWAEPQDTEKQVQWTRDLWTAIRPFSSGGVYVNFLSEDDGEDRVRAAYGEKKFERLVQCPL
jgi:FAD/FMN-containing dehydrogenase